MTEANPTAEPTLSLSGFLSFLSADLYGGTKWYGPYYSRNYGRYYVHIYKGAKQIKYLPYARFIMSNHLGYIVPDDMEVDHINGDKKDDRLENLQLLSPGDNTRKSQVLTTLMTEQTCPHCEKTFSLRTKIVRNHAKRGKHHHYCSQTCAAKDRRKHGSTTKSHANSIS